MLLPTSAHASRLSDFDYRLPLEQIAQRPAACRDRARLLVSLPHARQDRLFRHLPDLLAPGDLLVLNDTRVIPARFVTRKSSGGRLEVLLVKPLPESDHWEAMASGSRRIAAGMAVELAPGLQAMFGERLGAGFRVVLQATEGDVATAIQRHGNLPLPPYITGSDPRQDRHRYQTVFARHAGAVAAPTAGLHFTVPLLARLRARGVQMATVTLHVGPGTFQPVREEDLSRHHMHREWCCLPRRTARLIHATHARRGRVIAVGTTALRVLESAALPSGRVRPFAGETGLFILPGYRFRTVDALITNFHLPRSTLLMLVAAFIGKQRLERDYAHAMRRGYRFYSYGDAQLLFPDKKP
ncbi:MAG: tRNA preQ1(34) S-adenosylmethionine ribosyltransferase-isomerase QueA [Magnetococcales bacterium]|nr:tRNA preQ1(34) S-adenosylmethionine ribosyltransferase-isomerase QueA [Magnetococcales bacterium]